MTEIQLGKMNRLRVVKKVEFGYYLEGTIRGDRQEVLLPNGELTSSAELLDQEVDVFIYLDQEERIIATMKEPLAQVGDFAYLEVAWVNNFGAFLHWGPLKDLFVPFREQKMKMQKGQSYIVHLHVDPESYRIMASAKVEHYLDQGRPPYRPGDEVELLIWQKTELGLKAIVDNRFGGLKVCEAIAFSERLDEARRLLRETRMTGEEIAGKCGYESPCALRRAFRRAFGQTMAECRRDGNRQQSIPIGGHRLPSTAIDCNRKT